MIRSDEGIAVKRQLSTTVANLPLIIISVDKFKCWCFTDPGRSTTVSSESYLSTMVKYIDNNRNNNKFSFVNLCQLNAFQN